MLTPVVMRKSQFFSAICLDIQNAFNTKPWQQILVVTMNVKVPGFLVDIVRNYVDNRWVETETSVRVVSRQFTCGVLQGSVLRSVVWNIRI